MKLLKILARLNTLNLQIILHDSFVETCDISLDKHLYQVLTDYTVFKIVLISNIVVMENIILIRY